MTLVHAFSGSDTNSAVYKQSKLPTLTLLDKLEALMEEADLLLQKGRTPETICEAEVRIFVMLYYGKDTDSLTDLKYMNI